MLVAVRGEGRSTSGGDHRSQSLAAVQGGRSPDGRKPNLGLEMKGLECGIQMRGPAWTEEPEMNAGCLGLEERKSRSQMSVRGKEVVSGQV